MEELQIEIGGNEVGELVIVVLLVDMEQLVAGSRHDAKTILSQV